MCSLAVVIDSQLSLGAHVAALCCSSYYQLWQLCTVAQSLSDTAKTLVHAFVSSQLHYCNTLLHGMSEGLLHCIQSVQNAATQLDIIPILWQLHWLPMWQRVHFMVAILVISIYLEMHQHIWQKSVSSSVRQHAPTLLDRDSDLCICGARCPHNTFGDWCIAAAGPCLWYCPPSYVMSLWHSRRVQTVVEDTPVRRPRHLVTILVKSAVSKLSYLLTYSLSITSRAAMVTDYGGHRRTLLPLREINVKACTPLNFTQITEHIWELNPSHVSNLFNYSTYHTDPLRWDKLLYLSLNDDRYLVYCITLNLCIWLCCKGLKNKC